MAKKQKTDIADSALIIPCEPESKALQPVTPMDLLIQGKEGGATIEQMERLFDLQLKFDANEARKAYFKAVAAFKAVSIEIIKDKHVHFDTSKGPTDYDHSTLGAIVGAITAEMSKFGLSHNWSMEQPDGVVKVSCRLAHELGFSETVSMQGPPDASGGKNPIQALGSTKSYLERYTLMAITGLASKELTPDDDGQSSEQSEIATITEDQEYDIQCKLKDVNRKEKGFCTHYGIKSVGELPAAKYADAVKLLTGSLPK